MRAKDQENLFKQVIYSALIIILIPVTVIIMMSTILYAVYVIPKIPNYLRGEKVVVAPKFSCPSNFVELETGCYTIGKFMKSGVVIDWFDLNSICEKFLALPVSIESDNELDALNEFILMENFENATTFATSGYLTFDELPSKTNSTEIAQLYFTWFATGERLNLTKWSINDTEVRFYDYCIALILVDGELYMKTSSCQEDYFICEYQGRARLLSIRAEYYLEQMKDIFSSIFI